MSHKQKTLFQSWKQSPQKSSYSNYKTPSTSTTSASEKAIENSSTCDDSNVFKVPNPIKDNEKLEISGFDLDAGKTWIYPTNYTFRDYQFSIVKEALFKNTMVVLPTGLGKTFIAAVIMYNIYRWYPKGKVVFMAPTKPLVAQQVDSCFKVTGISEEDTTQMTGNTQPEERKLIWQIKRVFFLTPQVLANDLVCNICPAESIKCLVVDEAHKALGNHAYCQVIHELLSSTNQFRVLALTATPGSDTLAVRQVISNLLIFRVEIRTEDSDDVKPYIHARDIEKIVVPLGDELTAIRSKFLDIINIYLKRLVQRKAMTSKNPSFLSKFQVLKLRELFSQHPPDNIDKHTYGLSMADFSLCISLYHAYELLLNHGVGPFYNFLLGVVNGDKSTPHARSELRKNYEFEEIMKNIEEQYITKDGVKSPFQSAERKSIPDVSVKLLHGHPKLVKLKELVLAHFQAETGVSQDTRIMIFSQYRDSVNEITEMLDKHKPVVKVMSFIGQATKSGNCVGFSQKHQLKVIEDFRKGGYNTLVSTCVGEEGLDIGEVDLIICFDYPKSPIRSVQRMGRTGRARKGRIIVLVTEGKEEQIYNSCEQKKKSVNKAILKGFSFAAFYQNNPSMIPSHIMPTCVKTQVTIKPKGITRKKGSKKRKTSELTDEEMLEFNQLFKVPESSKPLLPKSEFVTLKPLEKNQGKRGIESQESVLSLSNWTLWQDAPQKSYMVSHSLRSCVLTETMELIRFPDTPSVPFSHKENALMFNTIHNIPRKEPSELFNIYDPEYNSKLFSKKIERSTSKSKQYPNNTASSPEVIVLDDTSNDKIMNDDIVMPDDVIHDDGFLFDATSGLNKIDSIPEKPKTESNLVKSLFGINFSTPRVNDLQASGKHAIIAPPSTASLAHIRVEDFSAVDITQMTTINCRTDSVLSILNKKMKAKLKRKSKELGGFLLNNTILNIEGSPGFQQLKNKCVDSRVSNSAFLKPKEMASIIIDEKDKTAPFEIINNSNKEKLPPIAFNLDFDFPSTNNLDSNIFEVENQEILEKNCGSNQINLIPDECDSVIKEPGDKTPPFEIKNSNEIKLPSIAFNLNFDFPGASNLDSNTFEVKNQGKVEKNCDSSQINLIPDECDSVIKDPVIESHQRTDLNSSQDVYNQCEKYNQINNHYEIVSKKSDKQNFTKRMCHLLPSDVVQKYSTTTSDECLFHDANSDSILEQLSHSSKSISDSFESFVTVPLKVIEVKYAINENLNFELTKPISIKKYIQSTAELSSEIVKTKTEDKKTTVNTPDNSHNENLAKSSSFLVQKEKSFITQNVTSNAGISTAGKESTQCTTSQLLSLISDTENAAKSVTPKKVSRLRDVIWNCSEDEVCPTPPKYIDPNLSKFRYRNYEDSEKSNIFPSYSSNSQKCSQELPSDCSQRLLQSDSVTSNFSVFRKIKSNDDFLHTFSFKSSSAKTQEFQGKETLNSKSNIPSTFKSVSPQKLVFDVSFCLQDQGNAVTCSVNATHSENLSEKNKKLDVFPDISTPTSTVKKTKELSRKFSKPVFSSSNSNLDVFDNFKVCSTINSLKKNSLNTNSISDTASTSKKCSENDFNPVETSKNLQFNSHTSKEAPSKDKDLLFKAPEPREILKSSDKILSRESVKNNSQKPSASVIKSNACHESNKRNACEGNYKRNACFESVKNQNKQKRFLSSPEDDDFQTNKKPKKHDSNNSNMKAEKFLPFSVFDNKTKTNSRKSKNELILSQAEVSCSDSSTDESDGDEEDLLEASFIDDRPITQNNTDEHAMYLKSIKSHVGLPQKYKLNYNCRKNDGEIFSQAIDADRSEYMCESFCVDDNEVDYESPKRNVLLKKKKDSVNKKKRKRIIMLGSSSEDEMPNKSSEKPIKMKSSGSVRNPPCDVVTISSSDDEHAPCNLKQNITFNIGFNNKVEKTVHETHTFNKKFSVGNQVSQNQNIISKSLNTANFDIVQDMNFPFVSESSSRYDKNVKINQTDHASTSNFSFDITWNAQHGNQVPATEKNSKTNINVVHQNSKSNDSKQNICNDTSSKSVTILADTRQLAGAKTVISSLRNVHRSNPIVMSLCGVDYIVSNRVAVDHFLDSELNNSHNSSKILDKIRTIQENYEKSYVIIEKDSRKQILSFDKRSCKFSEVALKILHLTPIKVLYSDSPEETSRLLFDLAQKEKSRNFHINIPVRSLIEKQHLFDFYSSLPHVNVICALNFVYNFPSIKMFLSSSTEDLKKKGFVSSRKADDILYYVKTYIYNVSTI